MQRLDGAFALWDSRGAAEPWLSAYAVDFLGRARERGLLVPDGAFNLALRWLRTNIVEQSGWTDQSVARGYALYVLAKAGQADAGAARYLQDTRLPSLPGGARVHLAAALSISGEDERARAALENPGTADRSWTRHDYGTPLRDAALRLTLMAEIGADTRTLLALGDDVATRMSEENWLSTQEMNWLVLAAKAIIERQGEIHVSLDGEELQLQSRPVSVFPSVKAVDRGYRIGNRGERPLRATIMATGVPAAPLPAEENGFSVTRAM